jgi:hypothetical protein
VAYASKFGLDWKNEVGNKLYIERDSITMSKVKTLELWCEKPLMLLLLASEKLLWHPHRQLHAPLLSVCCLSPTTEMISFHLWLHWHEANPVDDGVYYRIEPVNSTHLPTLRDVSETQTNPNPGP